MRRIICLCVMLISLMSLPLAQAEKKTARANLIFIHHSVGEDWLYRGLNQALNDSGFYVADTNYGWREYGDHTDTVHWPIWFTDQVMSLVYAEKSNTVAENTVLPVPGDNSIVMFKSCFPNSEVGDSIQDEQEIYRSLLSYFAAHPDKMFVLVTSPPMSHLSTPRLTRQIASWLTDRQSGWLKDYEGHNVYVFDFYNVLTHPDAHHQMLDGQEKHVVVPEKDTLYYDSNGDDHPNEQGSQKATREFISLLSVWYEAFLAYSKGK